MYRWTRDTSGLEPSYVVHDVEVVEPHFDKRENRDFNLEKIKEYVEKNKERGPKILPGHNYGMFTPENLVLGRIEKLRLDADEVARGDYRVDPLTMLRIARGQWVNRSPELHNDGSMDVSLLGSRNQYFEKFPDVKLKDMNEASFATLKSDAVDWSKSDAAGAVALRASDNYASDPTLSGLVERQNLLVTELLSKMDEVRAIQAAIMEKQKMAGTNADPKATDPKPADSKAADPALRAADSGTDELAALRAEMVKMRLDGVKLRLTTDFAVLRASGVYCDEKIETRIINVCAGISDEAERTATFKDLTSNLPKAQITESAALRAADGTPRGTGVGSGDVPAALKPEFDKVLELLKPEAHAQARKLAVEFPSLRAGNKYGLTAFVLGIIKPELWAPGAIAVLAGE